MDEAGKTSSKPEWLKKLQEGNEFNKSQSEFYPYNEVYIKKPDGNGYFRLDSYKPRQEIVSRKFTQFAEIEESSAKSYISELKNKYPVDAVIADVPSSQKLLGELNSSGQVPKLSGKLILEVPVQKSGGISKSILDYATDNKIAIRDIAGKFYN